MKLLYFFLSAIACAGCVSAAQMAQEAVLIACSESYELYKSKTCRPTMSAKLANVKTIKDIKRLFPKHEQIHVTTAQHIGEHPTEHVLGDDVLVAGYQTLHVFRDAAGARAAALKKCEAELAKLRAQLEIIRPAPQKAVKV